MKKIIFMFLLILLASQIYAHEIGDGSGTSYPTGIDTDSVQETTSELARIDVPNDIAAAAIAMEVALGTNPAGGFANVRLRFEALEASTPKRYDAATRKPPA